MEKQLELKHLAAYLPYGLKLQRVLSPVIDNIELTGLDNNLVYFNYTSCNYLHIKPILHPLSDLTKEIEVEGMKFVPMKYFYELYGGGYNSYENYCTHEKFTLTENHSLHFKDAQKLLEWHFDIFGLIYSGLAIDINTLNTPESWK